MAGIKSDTKFGAKCKEMQTLVILLSMFSSVLTLVFCFRFRKFKKYIF